MLKPEAQLKELLKGVEQVISKDNLLKKLVKSYEEKKPLIIKAGFDPSRPDLHLGHAVLLNKLKQFQNFGHKVIFLVGDFTSLIGDPSGRDETRPILTANDIKNNAKTYADQAFKILDKSKTDLKYNSQWLSKLSFQDILHLQSQYTVARMLERDDFQKRFSANKSISLHEFMYPLVQGYDSVAIKADVELGGTDQIFNLLMGRHLQKVFKQEPQVVITLPLLEGLDGVKKMSKSYDNYIALEDKAIDIFGKTMKLSDKLMLRYYELLSDLSVEELKQLKQDMDSGKQHPKTVKLNLATFFVSCFYSKAEAEKARVEFDKIFAKKLLPKDIEQKVYKSATHLSVVDFIASTNLVDSKSEVRRLIKGGGVSFIFEKNTIKIEDEKMQIDLINGKNFVLKIGKRKFLSIKVD
ncbi:MAG: tyrosine--tRNA ligase [Bdellovibrionaceae bacterium]|nr:tyrosine--tRNA ligase [Pseudobdellovibrionaceae bacterium]